MLTWWEVEREGAASTEGVWGRGGQGSLDGVFLDTGLKQEHPEAWKPGKRIRVEDATGGGCTVCLLGSQEKRRESEVGEHPGWRGCEVLCPWR